MDPMPNATALKFGYPDTVVAETDRWLVQLRPRQPGYGSLVLICKEAANAFGDLSPEAFGELKTVTSGAERTLRSFCRYEKINYLMLMMVDRDVHFHVLPRYAGTRERGGRVFPDAGWPGAPDLEAAVALEPQEIAQMTAELRAIWSDAA